MIREKKTLPEAIESIFSGFQKERLQAANAALKLFAPDTCIELREGRWYVCWVRRHDRNKRFERRWAADQGSQFPVWYRQWAHGGTCCMALNQLMRWLQGRPVFPLGTWMHWTGETVKLGSPKIVEILKEAGWPAQVDCVACGQPIISGLDWYNLGKVSGPCHYFVRCIKER